MNIPTAKRIYELIPLKYNMENQNIELKNNINLLWTGGWDSTFQLLQLLLRYKSPVSPYYLIDANRPSTGKEILTMKRIKEHLFNEYPHTKKLLDSIQYINVEDIPIDVNITKAYNSILKYDQIGIQYEWLARLCEFLGIDNMQLSFEKPHIVDKKWAIELYEMLIKINSNNQEVSIIDKKYIGQELYTIFKYFHLPIREITKKQMVNIADKQGWTSIMNLTWFCHNPTCKGKPCGKCKPCQQVMTNDMQWRIPYDRRLISHYYRNILWPLKSKIKLILINLGLMKKRNKS